jgi:hypothetical protein
MNLVRTEMRHALHRRAIRVLIAIALLGCVIAGTVAFLTSRSIGIAQMRREGHPALVTEWWVAELNEGFLSVAMIFLILGGLYGGATVAGAEWRVGTMTTVLTWEPRRLRLYTARSVSAVLLAFTISTALQVVFLASLVPAVVLHGTADGADGPFWWALLAAIARTSLLTAAAALLAVALATVARNTAFAVIAVFSWLLVVESLVRELLPSLSEWMWAENIGTVMAWAQIDEADFNRGPLVALGTLAVYCTVVVVVGAASFTHRDIGAAT